MNEFYKSIILATQKAKADRLAKAIAEVETRQLPNAMAEIGLAATRGESKVTFDITEGDDWERCELRKRLQAMGFNVKFNYDPGQKRDICVHWPSKLGAQEVTMEPRADGD